MKNKIIIDVQHGYVKVAMIENGQLAEFYSESNDNSKFVGSIYKGKVVNVLPGMQAAFVNIGLEKNAYLYCGESMVDTRDIVSGASNEKSELSVKIGDEIMVQVVKDPFGTKGVRVTQQVSLPGRYVVLMPGTDFIGLSRKIEDEDNKARLIALAEDIQREKHTGLIIRTAGENADEHEIKKEIDGLIKQYDDILRKYAEAGCPETIHRESDIEVRAIRDLLNNDTTEILINHKKTYETLVSQFSYLMPKKVGLFKYVDSIDLMDECKLTGAIENILKRKVVLKNGAYLIIDKTEALTAIDVNTGKYVGSSNLEQTVFETNLVAADEIARQLRLRNIGGIIIIDFIDMELEEHNVAVTERLTEALKHDRIKTSVVGMTSLGLLQVTRKKTRSDVGAILTKTCPYCHGEAVVLSDTYVISKIRRELYDFFGESQTEAIMLNVNPSVFSTLFSKRLLEKECAGIWADKRIYVMPEISYRPTEFTVEPLGDGIISVPDTAKLLY